MSTTAFGPAFFLALLVILLACRLTAALLRPLGQPPVVAEMIAGVLLGPSALGAASPWVEHEVFPDPLRPVLYAAGQFGLALYMFQCGYEFRADRIRPVARSAVRISAAGVALPLALGAALVVGTHHAVRISPAGVGVWVAALFTGVTLSITAFPMLARIISERGLTGSRFGAVSLASGALDDVVAWLLLAVVLSLFHGSAGPAALALGGGAGLVAMLVLLRRSSARVLRWTERLDADQLLLVWVLVLCLAAWGTDRMGLYAVFGAFSLGIAFPRSHRVDQVLAAAAPFGRIVLLPLFFTFSGLNTEFGLLFTPGVLLFTLGCTAVAVVGKFGGCWGAARLAGEPGPVALRVATLMNARGLMQLIAINVGLSEGIVTRTMFTVLVVVALVTTVMATPLLRLWDRLDGGGSVPTATAVEAQVPSVQSG